MKYVMTYIGRADSRLSHVIFPRPTGLVGRVETTGLVTPSVAASSLRVVVFMLFVALFPLLFPVLLFGQESAGTRELYRTGRAHLDSDNPYDAIDFFRSSLRENPAYVEARLGMVEALFRLGEYGEASAELERAKPYARGRRDFVLLDARVLMAQGDYEKAIVRYNDLLAQRPHDADANRGLAEIYALNGQKELAEQAYSLSLRYLPGDRRALLQLVLLHDAEREREKAESALSEVLRLFPENLTVRLNAAEHYALYGDWNNTLIHLNRAKSLAPNPGSPDPRYRRVQLLDASLSLRRGDPAGTLLALENLPGAGEPDALFLLAKAYRELGEEELAQQHLARLTDIVPNDEIVRIFREEPLIRSTGKFAEYRNQAASWHLEQGRRFENEFYYDRAFSEYRLARLIDKLSADSWIAYIDLIRKKGFQSKYEDVLTAALSDIPKENPQRAKLERRRELLEHSGTRDLPQLWGIDNPWDIQSLAWNSFVYILDDAQSLPLHDGAAGALGSYFAFALDGESNINVSAETPFSPLQVKTAASFAEAFRDARGKVDYFILLGLAETERSFHGRAELFIARTGESLADFNEIRTGLGRVGDSLNRLAANIGDSIPVRSRVVAVKDNKLLLDRGTWHGIDAESPWLLLRRGGGKPALTETGISYGPDDILGTLEITKTSESLSEAKYEKSGEFDFLSPGDEAFLLPLPEKTERDSSSPDPAFRARLLSIP